MNAQAEIPAELSMITRVRSSDPILFRPPDSISPPQKLSNPKPELPPSSLNEHKDNCFLIGHKTPNATKNASFHRPPTTEKQQIPQSQKRVGMIPELLPQTDSTGSP